MKYLLLLLSCQFFLIPKNFALTHEEKHERIQFLNQAISQEYDTLEFIKSHRDTWDDSMRGMRTAHRVALVSAVVSGVAATFAAGAIGSATLFNGQAVRLFAGRFYGSTFAVNFSGSAVLLGSETLVQVTQVMRILTFFALIRGTTEAPLAFAFVYSFTKLNRQLQSKWINNLAPEQRNELAFLLSAHGRDFLNSSHWRGSSQNLFSPRIAQINTELENWFTQEMAGIDNSTLWSTVTEFFTRRFYKESVLRWQYYAMGVELSHYRILNLYYLKYLLENS